MKWFYMIMVGVLMISFVSAATDFGYNNLNKPTLSKTVINYTQVNVNNSDYWDALDTPNDITDMKSVNFSGNIKLSADNGKAYFGASDDASFYYDGTDFILDPKEVGTGKFKMLGDMIIGEGNLFFKTTSNYIAESAGDFWYRSAGDHIFYSGGFNERMRIENNGDLIVNNSDLYVDTSTGNVGMGTTSPLADLHIKRKGQENRIKLEVDGNQAQGIDMRKGSTFIGGFLGTSSSIDFYSPAGLHGVIQMFSSGNIQFQDGSNGNNLMLIEPDGNILVQKGNLTTNYDLNVQGNWTGNSYYGELWNYTTGGGVHAISSAGEWINVTTGTVCGLNNGFTCSGGKLTTLIAGVYDFEHGVSFDSVGGDNDEFMSSIGINGIAQEKCTAFRDTGTGSAIGSKGLPCKLNLDVGDEVSLVMQNMDDADDLTIYSFNLGMERIGN